MTVGAEPALVHAAGALREDFVDAMAAAVTGVTVVTTDGVAGRLGLTVSAMVSVSADPPLLLVSVRRHSILVPALIANRVFGVNVLSASQTDVADTFAGRGRAPYDFAASGWETGVSGVPLLRQAAARFECDVVKRVEAGSHTLLLGSVRTADRSGWPPLAYAERRYASTRPLPGR